jgi:outer membrane protein TolC
VKKTYEYEGVKHMKKVYLGFLLPFSLYSQSLNGLIQDATKNRLIDSSQKSIESIQKEYESVKSSYLPKLTVGATYSNTNEETAVVADSSITSYANINYTLYDGGAKDAKYRSYESSIKSGDENLKSLKNRIALDVINYYFNYQSLISQKEAKLKEIETLEAQKLRLERFLEAGTTTKDEVDKIISRVQIANVILHEIELNIQTILHNLEYITSKKVSINSGSTIKDFTNDTQEIRNDIKALAFDMQTIQEQVRIEKSANYPTVSLDNTYSDYDQSYDNPAYDSGLKDLTWKLYDFGATKNSYESVYKKYQAQKSRYEYEKNKSEVDLKLAFKSYNIAKLKISSAESGLKAAMSTYEMIEKKYKNGLVDNVAYLEALSEKYNAISSLESAKYDLEIKKANIIYHSGKNLQEYIK